MLIPGGHPPAGLHRGQDTWKRAEPNRAEPSRAASSGRQHPRPLGAARSRRAEAGALRARAARPRRAAGAGSGGGAGGWLRGTRGRGRALSEDDTTGTSRCWLPAPGGPGEAPEPSRAEPRRAQSCRRCARRAPAVPGSRAAAGGTRDIQVRGGLRSVCPSVRPCAVAAVVPCNLGAGVRLRLHGDRGRAGLGARLPRVCPAVQIARRVELGVRNFKPDVSGAISGVLFFCFSSLISNIM